LPTPEDRERAAVEGEQKERALARPEDPVDAVFPSKNIPLAE
jgi:hypothetical protein